jgi:hypothetical protein
MRMIINICLIILCISLDTALIAADVLLMCEVHSSLNPILLPLVCAEIFKLETRVKNL